MKLNGKYKRFFGSKDAFWIIIFIFIAVVCFVSPILPLQSVSDVNLGQALAAPSREHLLGTDSLGRDVLSRVLHGGIVSLLVASITTAVGMMIGLVYGGISGYVGGKADMIMMRLVDVLYGIPSTILVLAFQMAVENKVAGLLVIMSLTNWMTMARIIRSQFLELKQKEFIKLAKNLNVPAYKIVFNHLVRNSLTSIIIVVTFVFGGAIVTESALSFLGVGIPLDIPSWGNMINGAQSYILIGAWWVAFFPGILIILSTLCINFIGEHLKKQSLQ